MTSVSTITRQATMARLRSVQRHNEVVWLVHRWQRQLVASAFLFGAGLAMLVWWLTEPLPVDNWWWGAIGVALCVPFLALLPAPSLHYRERRRLGRRR